LARLISKLDVGVHLHAKLLIDTDLREDGVWILCRGGEREANDGYKDCYDDSRGPATPLLIQEGWLRQ
jgi:hypothetical protein